MQIQWTLEPVEPPMLGLHRPPFTASPQKEGVLLTSPKYFKSRVQKQKWQDGNMIVLWSTCRHRFRCLQLECFGHFECSFCCLQLSDFDSIFDDCGFVHQTTASLKPPSQRSFMKVIHLGLFYQKGTIILTLQQTWWCRTATAAVHRKQGCRICSHF